MDNISIFNNSAVIWLRKIPHRIIIWLILVIILLITMAFIFFFLTYEKVKVFDGIIREEGNNYRINILVPEQEINTLINKPLVIDNSNYSYTITNISDDYYLDNNITYREVSIKTDILTNHVINNNIIELKFIINKTTLFKQLKEKIKKGMI